MTGRWRSPRRLGPAVVIFAALALRATGLKVSAVAARLRLPAPGRRCEWWSVPGPRIIAAGFRGGIRQKRRPRLLSRIPLGFSRHVRELSGFRPDVPSMQTKRGRVLTVRLVTWADRERTADLVVSHVATYQLRYAALF